MVQLDTVFVHARKQESDAERTAHQLLLGVFREHEAQIADALRERPCFHGFVESEPVVLSLHSRPLNERASVGSEPRVCSRDVAVDFDDLFDARRLEQRGGESLLDSQDDAVRGLDADSSGPELDGLDGVLDLEEAAFR